MNAPVQRCGSVIQKHGQKRHSMGSPVLCLFCCPDAALLFVVQWQEQESRQAKETDMVGQADIKETDTGYFDIAQAGGHIIVLRSKNTGHGWCLSEQEICGHRTFRISHRHGPSGAYHPHGRSRPSVRACCDYIMDHDSFHLEREMKKKERRERRLRGQA